MICFRADCAGLSCEGVGGDCGVSMHAAYTGKGPVVVGMDLASKPDEAVMQLPCGKVLRGQDAILQHWREPNIEEIARIFGVPAELLR